MTFDAFAQMGKAWETWQKLADDSFARFAGMTKEMEKLEARNMERTESAIDEAARLTKATLSYGAQLGAEWRKLSLEAFQKGAAGDVS